MPKNKSVKYSNFINEYVKALNNGRAALFAGAGLSIGSGGISWSELLREDANSIGIDVSRENDLISVAQYIYNESGTRQTITNLLKNKILKDGMVNENHKILSKFPISKIWTTNYDDFIEKSLSLVDKTVDIKRSIHDMSTEVEGADVTVYKMHGDIGLPNNAVLLKDDYEIYDKKNELFTKTLQTDLLSNTFLFIGFSFDDPNLENILSKVRIMLEGNPRRHYCILKKIKSTDPEFVNLDQIELQKELRYRKNKQKLRVNDLMRYGIRAVLVDSYDEIPILLNMLNRKYLANKIFVSGAFEEVDNFLGYSGKEAFETAEEFCRELGKQLFEEGFEVSTGFGLNVGRNLLTGFHDAELSMGKTKLNNRFHIKPFPLNQSKKAKLIYRKKLLSECGVSIYLFGNKIVDGESVISTGVKQEYKVAKGIGHKIIAVGSTGYASEKIWKKEKPKKNSEELERYLHLNRSNQDIKIIINNLMSILKDYREDPSN